MRRHYLCSDVGVRESCKGSDATALSVRVGMRESCKGSDATALSVRVGMRESCKGSDATALSVRVCVRVRESCKAATRRHYCRHRHSMRY